MVPFLLFALPLPGFLHLTGAWTDIAKHLKPNLSPAAFKLVDDTAKQVLAERMFASGSDGAPVAKVRVRFSRLW